MGRGKRGCWRNRRGERRVDVGEIGEREMGRKRGFWRNGGGRRGAGNGERGSGRNEKEEKR